MQSYTKFFRIAGLVASTALASTVIRADVEKSVPDKDPMPAQPENYVTISGQKAKVTGDKAAYQAENWTAKNGFAGIEDFQYSETPAKDVTVKADGHFLAGQDDYLAHINVAKTDIGSFDVGYKRFRTYYDNAGGFFLPTEGSWLPTFPQELYVDRSKFWAEANLVIPNMPVVTVRYTNELRKGRKDTTIWGPTDFTGLSTPSNVSASTNSAATRYIVPGYLELAERHQTLEAIVKKTFGKTTVELSAVGDQVDNLDTKVGNRYPNQAKTPLIATTPVTTVGPSTIQRFNNAAVAFDRLDNKADTYTFTGKVETNFNTKLKGYAGVSYSTLKSDFNEERPVYTVTPYGTPAANYVVAYSSQAQGLVGNSDIKTLTANLGVEYKIANNLTSELVLKGEDRKADASAAYQTVGNPAVSATGVITPAAPVNINIASSSSEKALTPELNLRYTGIKHLSLYGTAEYRRVRGDESVNRNVVNNSVTFSDVNEDHGRYTVGANWVASSFLTLRAETFYKDHQNDFRYTTPTNTFFLLGYKMKGARITATLKPSPEVTVTTRYVYQTGTMDTESAVTANFQSMDSTSHNIGTTLDWNPIKQFYMQFNINFVYDVTSTAYPGAGDATATTSGNNAQRNADNDYLTGSVIAGFVVDKVTNAEVQYTQYKADNFHGDYVAVGMPYGMSETNDTVTLGVKRQLTDKLVASVKLGWLKSKNETTYGRTDYTARVAYLSLQQAF